MKSRVCSNCIAFKTEDCRYKDKDPAGGSMAPAECFSWKGARVMLRKDDLCPSCVHFRNQKMKKPTCKIRENVHAIDICPQHTKELPTDKICGNCNLFGNIHCPESGNGKVGISPACDNWEVVEASAPMGALHEPNYCTQCKHSKVDGGLIFQLQLSNGRNVVCAKCYAYPLRDKTGQVSKCSDVKTEDYCEHFEVRKEQGK